jgi:glycosyltransferase involved in cell wall biosynthesis
MTTDRVFASPSARIGLVSTYPPTLCGLATFASALGRAMAASGREVVVVQAGGIAGGGPGYPPVVAVLQPRNPASLAAAAEELSRCDTVIVQHEYGIYGGDDGAEVVDLIDAIDAPVIVVLHTVPLRPTPHQHQLMVEIAERADRLVVMSTAAYDRLCDGYPVRSSDVEVIPHGATLPTRSLLPDQWDGNSAPQLLTWGLLGPGKGIEHAIEALTLLAQGDVRPRYTIAGVTHPNVVAREGHRYADSLAFHARLGDIADTVTFDERYRDTAELTEFVASSYAVVLPYDSKDQVTSGVLVDALAAGRPIIATVFPHAVELLATGAGLLVPHGDAASMATAIRAVVNDRDLATSMAVEAQRIAPSLSWPSVAAEYIRLCDGMSHHAGALH